MSKDKKDEKESMGKLEELFLKSRTIMLYGEINQKVAREFCTKIQILAAESDDDINVFVNSPGGHVESGDSIHDMIKFVKPRVKVIGTGWVASAGALIYSAPPVENRFSLPNTRYMLHQPSGGVGGQASDISIEADQIVKMRERLNQIFADQTGQPIDRIAKDTNRNFWMTPTEAKDEELPNLLQETLEAIEQAKEAAGKADQEILFGGLEEKLAQLAAAAESAIQNNGQQSAEEDAAQEQQRQSNEKAEIAEDELKVALRQEIGQGLVAVDRQEDKVIITVGAGGAFPSGSAKLTDAARTIMEEIAGVSESGSGEITVSGHTDDVPLIFGSQYRDNWDLAAARAASVVQALEGTGKVPAGRLQAISYGESQPVESNETARGRATNRRIEIEINY